MFVRLLGPFVLLLALLGCTDPITVGSDLLDDDRATVGRVVDLPFTTRVIPGDSVITYVPRAQFERPGPVTFGQISDPDFGTVRHALYLTPILIRPDRINPPIIPPYASSEDITVDSAVLLIPIDTLRGFYGTGRRFPIALRPLIEKATLFETFYSNVSLATGTANIATVTELQLTDEPTEVRDTAAYRGDLFSPHLRLRLTDEVARQLQDIDEDDYANDSTFIERFAGLYLEPTGDSDALVTLAANAVSPADDYNGINVYYKDATGTPREFRIPLALALPQYTYDFAGSQVQSLLEDGNDADLIAVMGQQGLMTEIDLGDVTEFQGRVINQAKLTVTLAEVAGVEYDEYPAPTRLELWYRESATGPLLPIADRLKLGQARAGANVTDFFLGGGREEDSYSPTFTIHMQRILDEQAPPRLYLRVTPLQIQSGNFRPNRAFLNGPDAPEQPATISITFTDLN
jgi:hypothetical protein